MQVNLNMLRKRYLLGGECSSALSLLVDHFHTDDAPAASYIADIQT
jgi:hypothetical protein